MLHSNENVLDATVLHLKMVKKVNFMLHIFYHNKQPQS